MERTSEMLQEKLAFSESLRDQVIEKSQSLISRSIRLTSLPNKVNSLIGMRRVGKTSYLAKRMVDLIASGVSKKQILYVNFEDCMCSPIRFQNI